METIQPSLIDTVFQHSAAAGIILISLIFVWRIVQSLNSRDKDRTIEFTRTIVLMDERHREERELWSAAEDRRQKESTAAIRDLAETLKETLDKIKPGKGPL